MSMTFLFTYFKYLKIHYKHNYGNSYLWNPINATCYYRFIGQSINEMLYSDPFVFKI